MLRDKFIHTYQAITVQLIITTRLRKESPAVFSLSFKKIAVCSDWRCSRQRQIVWEETGVGSDRQEGRRGNNKDTEKHSESDNRGLRQTEGDSLAWTWMVSGLESRGYLGLCYKFACSWSQRPEPGSRDTCCMEKSAEQPQRDFYHFHKFSAALTKKWNNSQRCGIFIVLMYQTMWRKGKEICGVRFTKWLHTEQTHCRGQRSPLRLIYWLNVMLLERYRSDRVISIFKPIPLSSMVFVGNDHIGLTCTVYC